MYARYLFNSVNELDCEASASQVQCANRTERWPEYQYYRDPSCLDLHEYDGCVGRSLEASKRRKVEGGLVSDQSELYSEELERLIDTISTEFHDAEHFASNRTHVYNVWRSSGLPEQVFLAILHEARAKTKQRGDIRTPAHTATALFPGARKKTPYFFRVLENAVTDALHRGNRGQAATRSTGSVDGKRRPRFLQAIDVEASISDSGVIVLDSPIDYPAGRYRVTVLIEETRR